MSDTQHEQTLDYFRAHAMAWAAKAIAPGDREVNVIRQRNGFVLHVASTRSATRTAIDVGCGTGDLVCDLVGLGIDAVGVDFAPEMIEAARVRARDRGAADAQFVCASFFEHSVEPKSVDLLSANGFIEYISPADLRRFLSAAYEMLSPGGSLVVGSRNRLFNIASLNAFSLGELDAGTAQALLREAVTLARGASPKDVRAIQAAPLQAEGTRHIHTEIDVDTRYQYTPAQLAQLIESFGFTLAQIAPIHVHGVPVAFKDRHPDVHAAISTALQGFGLESTSLVPYASSFMLHALKPRE